ncbi:MAG: hypothetical protein A2014_09230 [Spirochaetes bacterium GWF1_49_6]|nr:MAG: hypothetical protein A2014_09230 [Spirochaetes bacterium GWF1_49_6]
MLLMIMDITVMILFCFLCVRVLMKNPRNLINQVFFVIILTTIILIASVDVMLFSNDPVVILFFDRLTDLFSALIVSGIFILALVFPSRTLNLTTWQGALIVSPLPIMGMIAAFTPWVITSAWVENGVLIDKIAEGFYIWISLMLIYLFTALVLFIRSYRQTFYSRFRARLLLVFIGIIFAALTALSLSVLLPQFGFPDFYHQGISFSAMMFIFSIGYAIISEKLIDVNRILLDIMKWVFTAAVLIGIISLNIFVVEPALNFDHAYKKVILYSVSALIFYVFMVLFIPLMDQVFRRSHMSLQKVLDQFLDDLLNLHHTGELVLKTVSTVKTALGIQMMDFLIAKDNILKNLSGSEKDIKISQNLLKYFIEKNELIDLEEFLTRQRKTSIDSVMESYFEKHKAAVIIPLIYSDNLIGVINIGHSDGESHLNFNQYKFLKDLRKTLTIALNNAILVDTLKDMVQNKTQEIQNQKYALEYALNTNERDMYIFRSINEISRLLLSINYYTAKDLFHTIAEIFPGFINIENVAVYEYSKKDGLFTFLVANNIDLKVSEFSRTIDCRKTDILGAIIETGKSVFVGDITENKDFDPGEFKKYSVKKSIMGVPIKVRGEIIAVVLFIDKISNESFDKYDFYFVNTVSHLLNVSLERVVIFEEKLKSERFTAIGQMAANIIHDIKNPMAGILGFAECLISPEFSDEEKAEFSRLIISETERLVDLASEILEYTRGEIKIKKERVSAADYMKDIDGLLRMMFREQEMNLTIETEYDGELFFDANRMKRVFYNIAHNSMDAMKKDGEFKIRVYKKDDKVVFSLKDNGKGIPKEIRDKLFEPFVTHGKFSGTGLGLAITKEIVELHHGEITFETHTNSGTTFYIAFPV